MKRLLPFLLLVALGGCAQPSAPFQTPADHPASPDAAIVPAPVADAEPTPPPAMPDHTGHHHTPGMEMPK